MKEVFIKKYWADEEITFYVHFKDDAAIRQIEVSPLGTKYLSTTKLVNGESILYDQGLNQLSIDGKDLITREDFELIWKQGGD